MKLLRIRQFEQPANRKGQRLHTKVYLLCDGITAEIVTKKGESVFMSSADVDVAIGRNWHVGRNGYAACNKSGDRDGGYLHRMVLSICDERFVDHINGDRLDNRRENLRICTKTTNAQNKRMHRSNRLGMKGVFPQGNRYVAQICAGGKRRYLGCYETPEEAHEVYCLAADMLHGEFANHGGKNA